MPSKYYEVTACQHRHSMPSSRHLSWPSWPTVPVHGMVSAQPKSDIGWSRSCEDVKCKCSGYCVNNTPTVADLCAASDTKLFQLVVADPQHTLHSLLPPESTIAYNLRPCAHNLTLPDKHCALDSCNFFTRMLYANCYWLCNCYFILISFMSAAAVCHLHNKRRYIFLSIGYWDLL